MSFKKNFEILQKLKRSRQRYFREKGKVLTIHNINYLLLNINTKLSTTTKIITDNRYEYETTLRKLRNIFQKGKAREWVDYPTFSHQVSLN